MTSTPAEWATTLLTLLTASGETVTINNGTAPTSALGQLTKPDSAPVTDSVEQELWHCVIRADLDYAPERGHTATVGGVTYAIVSASRRRVAGTTIAYNLVLQGA